MKRNKLIVFSVLSIVYVATCSAQVTGSKSSDLGSPPDSFTAFSADYGVIVRAALPQVTAAGLKDRLRAVIEEATVAKSLPIRDLRTWASLFDLSVDPSKVENSAELIDLENASFQVDPEAGVFYVAIRHKNLLPTSRDEFTKVIPEIRRTHQTLIDRVGIPQTQIFFTDFREILAQSTPRPGLGAARESPIESVGATTTLLRSIGGLLVDGSFVRISSFDVQRLDMVDVRWPPLVLAPEVKAETVLAPSHLTDKVVKRVTSSARGRPVNVRMAVVLRPLQSGDRAYFVPSLRVGIKPKSKPVEKGYETEAGEEIYFDLVPGFEDLEDRHKHETVPENLERKLEKQQLPN